MKHVNIPTQWKATEALSVVAFLERVIEAVWRAHGAEMADFLCRATRRGFPAPPPHWDTRARGHLLYASDQEIDDDIPL